MKQISIKVPLTQQFPGVACDCGFVGTILAVVTVQKMVERNDEKGKTIQVPTAHQEIKPIGGTAFCPACGKQTPVDGDVGYLQVNPKAGSEGAEAKKAAVTKPKPRNFAEKVRKIK